MPEPGDIEIIWRAFELDPAAPRVQPLETSYAERLARKYGTSIAQADAMIERMTSVAAADGLTFRFDRIKPGNTFDAHRILPWRASAAFRRQLRLGSSAHPRCFRSAACECACR